MAGNDVFLYSVPANANVNDVRLRDPTQVVGSFAYTLGGATGVYALTGQAATFRVTRALAATAGTYVLTGNAATFGVAHALAGSPGAYALAGQTATLTYSPGAPIAPAVQQGGGGARKKQRKMPDWQWNTPIHQEKAEEEQEIPLFDLEAVLCKLEAVRDAKLQTGLAILVAKTSSSLAQAQAQNEVNKRDEARILMTLEELDVVMLAAVML